MFIPVWAIVTMLGLTISVAGVVIRVLFLGALDKLAVKTYRIDRRLLALEVELRVKRITEERSGVEDSGGGAA